jgi:hypothetical protein
MAARKLALEQVPVIELAHMSEAQKRAYVLADNQLALNAGWDQELLRLELADLSEMGFDLGLIGFGQGELERLLAGGKEGLTGDDEAPALPDEAVTRPGAVIEVRRYERMRLRWFTQCFDSADLKDAVALLDELPLASGPWLALCVKVWPQHDRNILASFLSDSL